MGAEKSLSAQSDKWPPDMHKLDMHENMDRKFQLENQFLDGTEIIAICGVCTIY